MMAATTSFIAVENEFESLSSTLYSCDFGSIRFVSGTALPSKDFYIELERVEERLSVKINRDLMPLFCIGEDDGYMNGGLIDTEYSAACVIFSSEATIITLDCIFEMIPSEAGVTELERKIRKYPNLTESNVIPIGGCTVFSKWEEPLEALVCARPDGAIIVCDADGEELALVASSYKDLEANLQSASFNNMF